MEKIAYVLAYGLYGLARYIGVLAHKSCNISKYIWKHSFDDSFFGILCALIIVLSVEGSVIYIYTALK